LFSRAFFFCLYDIKMVNKTSQKKEFLIEIPHPHFVYFFREIIFKLGDKKVLITCQDSGIITHLLNNLGLEYVVIGKKYNGLLGKAYGQFLYFLKFIILIRKHNISKALGMSPGLALAAKVLGIKLFFFDDDDSAVQPITKRITIPLSSYIITPVCLSFEDYGKKHFTYNGLQELAYLSPTYFKPNHSKLKEYNLDKNKFIIIRFNDFKAHHDKGHSGIPKEVRQQLVNIFKNRFDVFITTEGELDKEFKPFQLKIDPSDIHQIMYFAFMYIGDSQTMASEAAVLGTPSIRCNTFKNKISYLNELEYTYKLTYAFLPTETDEMINKINDLLKVENLKDLWSKRKEYMLEQMEDVPSFVSSFIKNR
jgi:uncharacterized protein